MNIWDPAQDIIAADNFNEATQKLEAKLAKLQANPGAIRRNKRVMIALGIIISIIGIVATMKYGIDWQVILLGIVPWSFYSGYILAIQNRLIKLSLAKANGWIYNPKKDKDRWQRLKNRFVKIFDDGRGQYITEQYWGNYDINGTSTSFWSGDFIFTVGSGKSSTTYTENVVAIKLPIQIKHPFYLKPEQSILLGRDLFYKRDIQTESNQFNRSFEVRAVNVTSKETEIINMLSPAVQENLLELLKKHGPFYLLFQHDAAIFRFRMKFLFQGTKTNLFKSVNIEPEDHQTMNNKFKELFLIIGNVLKYLD